MLVFALSLPTPQPDFEFDFIASCFMSLSFFHSVLLLDIRRLDTSLPQLIISLGGQKLLLLRIALQILQHGSFLKILSPGLVVLEVEPVIRELTSSIKLLLH